MYTTQPTHINEKHSEQPNAARRRTLIIGVSALAFVLLTVIIISVALYLKSDTIFGPSSLQEVTPHVEVSPPPESIHVPEFIHSLPAPLQIAANALFTRKPIALAITAAIAVLLIASIVATVVVVTLNARASPIAPSDQQEIQDTTDKEEFAPFFGSWLSIGLGLACFALIIGVSIGLRILSKRMTLFYWKDEKVDPLSCYPTNVEFLDDDFQQRLEGLPNDVVFFERVAIANGKVGLDLSSFTDASPVGKKLFLISEDITQFPADAICNAANQWGSHGSFISGVIHDSLGYDSKTGKNILLEKTTALGPTETLMCFPLIYYPPGTARAINVAERGVLLKEKLLPLNRHIRVILMATGPMEGQKPREMYIRKLYWYILQRCEELGVRHVVIPAISTGRFGGGDTNKTPIWVLETIGHWLESHPASQLKIVLTILGNDNLLGLYKQYLETYFKDGIPKPGGMKDLASAATETA
jgi:O-acetyl-ADP-ribose deacetylase (regulator of RNase III)